MRSISLRKALPAGVSPTAPNVYKLDIGAPYIKKLLLQLNGAATELDLSGFRIMARGSQIFPDSGDNATQAENGYHFFPSAPLEIDIEKSVPGSPYMIEISFYHTGAGSSITPALTLFCDEIPPKADVSHVIVDNYPESL